jgi:hypothetical protein
MNMTEIADLSFSPLGKIQFGVVNLQLLQRAGGLVLHMQIALSASWIERESKAFVPVLVTGRLWSDQPGMVAVGSVGTTVLVLRGYQTQENLYCDIATEQLLDLDERRVGGAVTFRFNVQAALIGAEAAQFPIAEAQMSLRIEREKWLQQLDQLGNEIGITIRVPLALGEDPSGQETRPSRGQAAARLRRARSELHDGNYEQCVATARLVLDNLERLQPSLAAPIAQSARNRQKDERWAALFAGAKSLTSAAHHDDEVTDKFSWTRADAEAVMAIVAALAAHILS